MCGSESSHQKSVEGPEDEESPLTDQLNKAWKRIADLETRVHDLTLQSTIVSLQQCLTRSHAIMQAISHWG